MKRKNPKARRNPGGLMVTLVLDETGSMESCREATISAVNEYLDGLAGAKETKDALVTMTSFNSVEVKNRCSGAKVSEATRLSRENYRPAAVTPLYDAIGQAIRDTEDAVKAQKVKPRQVLFVIQTDGYENASKEYTQVQVQKMIEDHKDEWTLVFLGANMDAWSMAQKIGGASLAANAMSYAGTPQATRAVMGATLMSTKNYAQGGQKVSKTFFSQN